MTAQFTVSFANVLDLCVRAPDTVHCMELTFRIYLFCDQGMLGSAHITNRWRWHRVKSRYRLLTTVS